MQDDTPFEIFAAGTPGLEAMLQAELHDLGWRQAQITPGGVTFQGGWDDVWRANLRLRGATRILARVGSFRALHLAQLDKRARKLPWGDLFHADVPLKVEVTCKRSRIYHAGAAKQRIERALTETAGLTLDPEAGMTLRARIDDDLCTFSIDTSGTPLHKRGHKAAVGKAPMRETLAALMLRACGYDGSEPVVDPMCGSGTFPIEAAEIACGLAPGRDRDFAMQDLALFDPARFPRPPMADARAGILAYGYDRDQGAIGMATRNAETAGLAQNLRFGCQPISALAPPSDQPGLVMINPPYGARIGNRKMLFALYATLGERLRTGFKGWRVGLVTSDKGLAKATDLPWAEISPPLPHGGLKVYLHQTAPLD